MLSVKDNVAEALGWAGRLSSQYEFAVASALTDVARQATAAMPAAVEAVADGGVVPFTRQAFVAVPARKARLVSAVAIKRLQAEYLAWLIEGGERRPKRKALRLPGAVALTAQGNLPAGTIARLVDRAKAGKRATKSQALRFGVSSQLDLFYGEPGDGRPAGVYKRVELPNGNGQLVPVVVFPQTSARYEQRWDFHGAAGRVVRGAVDAALARAWAKAKATAK